MYFTDLYNTQWHKVLSAKGRQSTHTKFYRPSKCYCTYDTIYLCSS